MRSYDRMLRELDRLREGLSEKMAAPEAPTIDIKALKKEIVDVVGRGVAEGLAALLQRYGLDRIDMRDPTTRDIIDEIEKSLRQMGTRFTQILRPHLMKIRSLGTEGFLRRAVQAFRGEIMAGEEPEE